MEQTFTILHVDDDVDEHVLFDLAVAEIDNSITSINAYGAEPAWEILRGMAPSVPDIIFLDLNMPTISGKQFLKALKRIPRYHDIPVIIYSTSVREGEKQELLSMGASSFLPKTGSFGSLKRNLETVMRTYTLSHQLKRG